MSYARADLAGKQLHFAAPTTGSVLFVGTEPHLWWMRYGKAIMSPRSR
ncbi:MAG: hypothetical protein WKH64_06965 [Chloroflexia bacterium]